jgi:hypothetical protein
VFGQSQNKKKILGQTDDDGLKKHEGCEQMPMASSYYFLVFVLIYFWRRENEWLLLLHHLLLLLYWLSVTATAK